MQSSIILQPPHLETNTEKPISNRRHYLYYLDRPTYCYYLARRAWASFKKFIPRYPEFACHVEELSLPPFARIDDVSWALRMLQGLKILDASALQPIQFLPCPDSPRRVVEFWNFVDLKNIVGDECLDRTDERIDWPEYRLGSVELCLYCKYDNYHNPNPQPCDDCAREMRCRRILEKL